MSMNKLVITAALLLGSALPAAADQRSHVVVPTRRAIEVHEYMPQSGAPGSLITVRGRGLRDIEYALVGGYKASLVRADAHEIAFRVPQQHGDGMIELYGHGRKVAVGRFTVFSMLAVEGFSPRSGKAGAKVEIYGQGFQHGDQVLMNGRPLEVLHVNSSRIAVRIPHGASTDHFTIMRHGGVNERTAERFYVKAEKPVISSVYPQQGAPGAAVRIAGYGFDQSCKVFYGQEKLSGLRYLGGSFEARIPHYAKSDEYLYVNCAGEQGRSPSRFELERFAAIHDVQPLQGRPGTRVTLRGDELGMVDRVLLEGKALPIVSRRENRLEVEIPRGAHSGTIALKTRGRLQSTSFRFHVLHGATIEQVNPGRVYAGQTVTLRGQGLDRQTRVYWGHRELEVLRRSQNGKRIEVLAPTHARGTQALYVDDGAGRVHTGASLEIAPRGFYTYNDAN